MASEDRPFSVVPGTEVTKPFKKILLALDNSERTPELVRFSSYLASTFMAEILVVSVVKMPTAVSGDEFDGSPANDNEEQFKASLTHIVQQNYGERSNRIQVKILHGEPAQRICEHAEYVSADLILMGSHGYGSLKRAVLGSTSSAVATKSKTSVLILK